METIKQPRYLNFQTKPCESVTLKYSPEGILDTMIVRKSFIDHDGEIRFATVRYLHEKDKTTNKSILTPVAWIDITNYRVILGQPTGMEEYDTIGQRNGYETELWRERVHLGDQFEGLDIVSVKPPTKPRTKQFDVKVEKSDNYFTVSIEEYNATVSFPLFE